MKAIQSKRLLKGKMTIYFVGCYDIFTRFNIQEYKLT